MALPDAIDDGIVVSGVWQTKPLQSPENRERRIQRYNKSVKR
jgi:hypothetical protein